MTNIGDLVRLQEVDLALDSRRATVADAEERIGETEDLIAAREVVGETSAALRSAESAQKDVELQADSLRAKIAPVEEKLYSGAIKNPKELSDLQADIDQLKRHLSTLEDSDLEALSAVEAAQAAHRAADEELAALEQEWREEQAELKERIERVGGEILIYDAQREELRGSIDPELLARYEHVRRAHQGRGVAKLDRNLCLGCRISLPVSTVNKARQGTTVIQCPNCERILYA
jgi:predicted  nucleic acid-binding Zn-ribbon protein